MTAHLALLGFIALMVGTPGPANLMAMLAGVTQGLRGCVGFISGMVVGKVGLNLFIGFGFGVVLGSNPILQTAFTYGSAGFMIWLAIKSWPRSVNYAKSRRYKTAVKFSFRDGVILHPLNPKAWMMVIIAWGHFAPALGDFSVQLPFIIFCFATCQLIFHSLWCALGAFLGRSFVYNQLLARVMIIVIILVVLVSLVYTPSGS
jgi:threonine/homoserine/homoserine lactone efflux protein